MTTTTTAQALILPALCVLLAGPARADEPAAKVKVLLPLDATKGQLPEALTADAAGNLFLSMGTAITKVTLEGDKVKTSVHATLPLPAGYFALGLKVGPKGCLYNVSGAFAPSPPGAFLWRICPGKGAAKPEKLATLDPKGFPNDLAIADDGSVYITDPFLGRVWRVDAAGGEPVVWLQDALLAGTPDKPALPGHFFGVDGITFDKGKQHLYFGNLDRGTVLRVALSGGKAGPLETVVKDPRLVGIDGLAFDEAGTLFAAINGQDRLVAIRGDKITVIAQGPPLDAPSSLVFGTQPGTRKNLYVSSFAVNRALGVPKEPPKPALLMITLQGGLAQR